ncbi:MAG: efflux RND transporter periplasmic adaptor subunit [Phycisphaerales bacterium]|nr:efflux RND transporter periplasmic adaptor subunit [Phycisphaerales bacterium]
MQHFGISGSFLICLGIFFFIEGCTSKDQSQNNTVAQDTSVINKINTVVGVAEIEPVDHILPLSSKIGGVVSKIYHDINDEVEEGTVILKLDNALEIAQLDQAVSKLSSQRAAIASSRANLHALQLKVQNNQDNFDHNKNLIVSGAITQQMYDDSKFDLESSQADVAGGLATLQEQEAKLSELEADVNYYQTLLDQKLVKAPAKGRILSMDIREGEYLSPTQTIGDFAPSGRLMAITEIDELFANKIRIGLPACIHPQGSLDTLATGSIFIMSPYLRKKTLFSDDPANMEDRRVREVRVLLDKKTNLLIGTRVDCTIVLDSTGR